MSAHESPFVKQFLNFLREDPGKARYFARLYEKSCERLGILEGQILASLALGVVEIAEATKKQRAVKEEMRRQDEAISAAEKSVRDDLGQELNLGRPKKHRCMYCGHSTHRAYKGWCPWCPTWAKRQGEGGALREILKSIDSKPPEGYVDLVFTRPPSPLSEFLDAEDHTGKSIRIGTWVERPDGYWALRVKVRKL